MKIIQMDECRDFIIRMQYPNNYVIQTALNVPNVYNMILNEIPGKTYNLDPMYINEAIDLMQWPDMEKILDNTTIYLVPYPAADHSNAHHITHEGKSIIFFWAKGTPEPRYKQHYIVTHEIGHVIENLYTESLDEYLEIKGWPKEERMVLRSGDNGIMKFRKELTWKDYGYKNDWHDCPVEWFAEDFRWLYGCDTAKQGYWSCSCDLPDMKVKEYFDALAGGRNESDNTSRW